jgi:3-hydroxyisobutyrate dehydrogenase
MCAEFGLDPSLFLKAIGGSPSDNPYMQAKGAMMLTGDFTPSFPLEGALKDVGLMIDAVGEQAASARLLGQVHAAYLDASVSGHAEEDMAAVATSFGFAPRPVAKGEGSE